MISGLFDLKSESGSKSKREHDAWTNGFPFVRENRFTLFGIML
jgi:hypothetical protein